MVYVDRKTGFLNAQFSREEYNKFDNIGKKTTKKFVKWLGWESVSDFDCRLDGTIDTKKPDIVGVLNDMQCYAEAEIKRDKHWSFPLKFGLDYLCRKNKFAAFRPYLHCMIKEDLTEILVTKGDLIEECAKCVGYEGDFGEPTSHDFKPHNQLGLIRVRKRCRRPGGRDLNDFFRIPYLFLDHYKVNKPGLEYELIHEGKMLYGC